MALRTHAGATREIEEILFGAAVDSMRPAGSVAPRAWSLEFPDLTTLEWRGETSGEARLSVCIATEDIVGPVSNGGIGTTYASLAEFLAQDGHDVTVLYLLDRAVDSGNLGGWTSHYAARGIKFVAVPDYFRIDGLRTPEERWLRVPYKMMRYLLEHPFDVVHVSEWRASGYFSLLAKHQGLAFRDTLFVVKASSPWLWNRMYSSQMLDNLDDLQKVHAERRCIELADLAIGGSAHLLRWMASRGYQLPAGRTFVQPNLVHFENLSGVGGSRRQPGDRVPIDEIAFFGRLEGRKGLLIFCHAIDRLVRQGVKLPPKISFVGKIGARLDSWSGESNQTFIAAQAKRWPVQVEMHTGLDQRQAIEYLLGGNRLAVMPSLIENSSLAVYEAAICGIPFVASNAGGTPELIKSSDHDQVLCDPHPIALADKVAAALNDGGYVAAPSFDNEANLEIWRKFHRKLAAGLARAMAYHRQSGARAEPSSLASVAICIYHTGNEQALADTLSSIARQDLQPTEVCIAVDAAASDALDRVNALIETTPFDCRVVATTDCDAGLSFNLLADAAASDFLVFLWEGTTLRSVALRLCARVAAWTDAGVLNCFLRVRDDAEGPERLVAIVPGGGADMIGLTVPEPQPLYVSRQTFLQLGGFATDYRALGYGREFLARAQMEGVQYATIPFDLASMPALRQEWLQDRGYNESVRRFRVIRPWLVDAPLPLQDLVLFANGLHLKLMRRRLLDHVGALVQMALAWASGLLTRRQSRNVGPAPSGSRSAAPAAGAVDSLMRVLETEAARAPRAPGETP